MAGANVSLLQYFTPENREPFALVRPDLGVVSPHAVLRSTGIYASRMWPVVQRRGSHWMVDTPDGRAVLRRYAPERSHRNVAYEVQLLEHLDGRGWPVPVAIGRLVEAGGSIWCAFRYLPGRPPTPRSAAGTRAEQRRRGQLLAQLHADMADLSGMGQRDGWRRADEGLLDRIGKLPVDEVLARYERDSPEDGYILRSYAKRMRERLSELVPLAPAPILIHGDFAPWNLRYASGHLSAILDFEMAHLDLRVADFALSWRGQYNDVVRGYEDVSPLEPVERELIVPIYWAWVIASAVAGIEVGETATEWAVRHLLRTEG